MRYFKTSFLLMVLLLVSACKVTGEAEDQFDIEEKEPKLDLGGITKLGVFKSKQQKENDELRARLERLENQQGQPSAVPAAPVYQNRQSQAGDITLPPIGGSTPAPNYGGVDWRNSASYQEWKQAKEGGNSTYQEFQEYKEWLEFKKLKEQNK